MESPFELFRPNLYEILGISMRIAFSTHLIFTDLFTVIIRLKKRITEFSLSASFFGLLKYKYFLQAQTFFLLYSVIVYATKQGNYLQPPFAKSREVWWRVAISIMRSAQNFILNVILILLLSFPKASFLNFFMFEHTAKGVSYFIQQCAGCRYKGVLYIQNVIRSCGTDVCVISLKHVHYHLSCTIVQEFQKHYVLLS